MYTMIRKLLKNRNMIQPGIVRIPSNFYHYLDPPSNYLITYEKRYKYLVNFPPIFEDTRGFTQRI